MSPTSPLFRPVLAHAFAGALAALLTGLPAVATAAEPATAKNSAEPAKSTGKRLEDDPYALEKLKKILEGGIPEMMTVKVRNPASANEDGATPSGSNATAASRKNRSKPVSAVLAADPSPPASLGLAPETLQSGGKAAASDPKHGKSAQGSHGAHWDYTGDYGPHAWGRMKPEFSACANGKTQSPVHIQPGDALPADLEPVGFEYGPLIGRIQHNGHTVQVDVQGNNMLVLRGKVYRLVQFHFHHPAEEMINYRGFPMVAHLVHKDSEGRLAVVALLMETGADNPVLSQVWARMPMKEGEQFSLDASRTSLMETLPKDRGYYTFQGSLTTPPCSEGVTWVVLKQPVQISPAQLQTFRTLFPLNARPVQPVLGRLIQESR